MDSAVFTQVEGLGINHEQKRPFLMINKTLIFPDIYLGNLSWFIDKWSVIVMSEAQNLPLQITIGI